ncbi:N-formylglutamate amidohydrolase [Burkholderia sp. MR1-5-21]
MRDEAFGHIDRGDAPILVAAPHIGTSVPDALTLYPAWRAVQGLLADPAGAALRTVAAEHGFTCIAANHHPCVLDVNVPADNGPLSPGLMRTSLCRTHTSRGESLYGTEGGPTASEVALRVDRYWRPFHDALATELCRLRSRHDNVLLLLSHASSWLSPYRDQLGAYDCSVGTNRGASCDRRLVTRLTRDVQEAGRSWVVNGSFADAFTAQHYGMPASGIHVMEIEFAGNWRRECEDERADRRATTALFGAMLDGLLETLTTLPKGDGIARTELALNPHG